LWFLSMGKEEEEFLHWPSSLILFISLSHS